MSTLSLPTFDDVSAAAIRIKGYAHRTPVMTSRTLNEELGAEVFFKCESLQRMGASVHGIDIANQRLFSFTRISGAARSDVRDLIVNGRASKSQHNGGECSVLEELVKPDFHGRERFGLLLLRFWRAARFHQIHIDTARSLSSCDADEEYETN